MSSGPRFASTMPRPAAHHPSQAAASLCLPVLFAFTLLACASSPGAAPATAASAEQPPAEPTPPAYEIINLYDAFGRDRSDLRFDFGFSALVRYGELSILFDTGSQAEVLKENAAALATASRSFRR